VNKVLDFLKESFEGSKANILFFAALLLFLTWMPLEFGARYINTQVAGQVICGALILLLFRENKILLRYPLWSISLFWIGVLSLSFCFSFAKLASLEELMRNVMYISLPMIIFSWAVSKNRIKLISYSLILIGLLVSIISLVDMSMMYFSTGNLLPTQAPLGRTNDLCAYLLLIFPLAFCNFLYEDDSYLEKSIYGISSIFIFTSIVLTFSRGIWLSLLFGIFLIFALGHKILKKNWIFIVVVVILCLIPIILNWESIITRFASLQNVFTSVENSIEWRKSLLRGSVKIFEDNPIFGTGLNTFAFVYSLYQERAGYFSINSHNYYLQLLTETGVVGFITFIVLALSILYISFKTFFNAEKLFKGISLGLLIGVITSLIHISVDIDWSIASIPIVFWLEVGLLISIYNDVGFKETRFSDFSSHFDYIKKPILITIAILLITIPSFNYLSLNLFSLAKVKLDNNDIKGAETYNTWAMRFAPYPSSKHHWQEAVILEKENKIPEAIKMIQKAIKLDKYNYAFYEEYSQLLLKENYEKNKKKALDVLIEAVTYNPYFHPYLYEQVGDFYIQKMNNFNEGLRWYEDAILRFPIAIIPSYERYTPDDRYQLYRIYKKLSNVLEKKNPKKSKDYMLISEYLLKTQVQIQSDEFGELTSTPTNAVKAYWYLLQKSPSRLKKLIYEKSEILSPPSDSTYTFIDFINIKHNIFNAKVRYIILIQAKNNINLKREIVLEDELIPTDKDGWLILSRNRIN